MLLRSGPLLFPTWYRSAERMRKKSPHGLFPPLSVCMQSTATPTLKCNGHLIIALPTSTLLPMYLRVCVLLIFG